MAGVGEEMARRWRGDRFRMRGPEATLGPSSFGSHPMLRGKLVDIIELWWEIWDPALSGPSNNNGRRFSAVF